MTPLEWARSVCPFGPICVCDDESPCVFHQQIADAILGALKDAKEDRPLTVEALEEIRRRPKGRWGLRPVSANEVEALLTHVSCLEGIMADMAKELDYDGYHKGYEDGKRAGLQQATFTNEQEENLKAQIKLQAETIRDQTRELQELTDSLRRERLYETR